MLFLNYISYAQNANYAKRNASIMCLSLCLDNNTLFSNPPATRVETPIRAEIPIIFTCKPFPRCLFSSPPGTGTPKIRKSPSSTGAGCPCVTAFQGELNFFVSALRAPAVEMEDLYQHFLVGDMPEVSWPGIVSRREGHFETMTFVQCNASILHFAFEVVSVVAHPHSSETRGVERRARPSG